MKVITVNFQTRQVVSEETVTSVSQLNTEIEDLSPELFHEDENFIYVSDCAGMVMAIPKKSV